MKNFKIKKSSVAIYVLALMLVTAGYWNYISKETQTLETVSVGETEQNTTDENLGDAQLVSNNELIKEEESKEQTTNTTDKPASSTDEDKKAPIGSNDYFEESRLSRDTMYSQTLETYKSMLNNSNVSEEQKAIVTQEITKLNQEKNAIMICEKLMITKGFSDCVIFANTDSISVIVEADELKTDEIAQIQNIVSREMGAELENIHIMTKN